MKYKNILTKTEVQKNMKLRKLLFDLARQGNLFAIRFLWDNFRLRITSHEENEKHLKHCEHCQSMARGERQNHEPIPMEINLQLTKLGKPRIIGYTGKKKKCKCFQNEVGSK